MTAVIPVLLFHGKGRDGKRYLLPLAPCGSVAPAGNPQLGEKQTLSVKPFGFASSPKGRAKSVEGTLLAFLLKGSQGRNGSASCLSL